MHQTAITRKPPFRHLVLLSALLGAAALGGCGDDADPVPPEISELTLADYTLLMEGGNEAIHGMFEFHDPNGDVEHVMIEVDLPDGTLDELGPLPLEDLTGREHGTVTFSLLYPRDTLGRYDLTVWLVDSRGQLSNELTGSVVSRL